MRGKVKKYLLYIVIASVVSALLAGFLAFGPPHLMEKTETPEFCAGCHVMSSQYEAWSHFGAHRRIKCIDCHLPNDNPIQHYVWKGISGIKDLISFHGGLVPERIEASPHTRKTAKANCIRCHGETVSLIDIEDRNCWECHRSIIHKKVGVLE